MEAKSNLQGEIRAWLRSNPGHHGIGPIAEGMGDAPIGSKRRETINRSLIKMVARGMADAIRVGQRLHYGYLREPMKSGRRRKASPGTAQERPKVKRIMPARALQQTGPTETVDEFLERGGQVERLAGFEAVRPYMAARPMGGAR